jgi:hypothetical protein
VDFLCDSILSPLPEAFRVSNLDETSSIARFASLFLFRDFRGDS